MTSRSIAYWQELWQSTMRRAYGSHQGLKFSTPSYVLADLAEELTLTHLGRRGARETYKTSIGRAVSRPGTSELVSALKSVQDALTQWKGWRFALEQVLFAQEQLELNYGEHCAQRLASLLEEELTSKGATELKELTNDMIATLLMRGHSREFVQRIPKAILSSYRTYKGHVLTDFPYDFHGSNAELIAHLDGLTLRDRLLRISYYFSPIQTQRRFVFQLRGLRIANPVEFAEAVLYDPTTEPRVTPGELMSVDETFGQEDENHPFPNIAISLTCDPRDQEAAKAAALRKAAQYLDLTKAYVSSTSTLRLVADEYIITDEQWQLMGHSSSVTDSERFIQMHDAPELDPTVSWKTLPSFWLHGGERSITKANGEEDRRLSQALHLIRRGEEATRPDDQLTHHWIAIETLLSIDDWRRDELITPDESVISLTARILPILFIRRSYVFSKGWWIHKLLRDRVRPKLDEAHLVLPDDLMSACHLTPVEGQTLHLRNIVKTLPQVLNAISESEHPFLREQIENAIQFYADPRVALAEIDSTLDWCSDCLRRIYRARNRIVHDAVIDGPLFSVLANHASTFSHTLLRHAVFSIYRQRSLKEALVTTEAEVSRWRFLLRAGKPVDFLAQEDLNPD